MAPLPALDPLPTPPQAGGGGERLRRAEMTMWTRMAPVLEFDTLLSHPRRAEVKALTTYGAITASGHLALPPPAGGGVDLKGGMAPYL
jgi:hypothetical protein